VVCASLAWISATSWRSRSRCANTITDFCGGNLSVSPRDLGQGEVAVVEGPWGEFGKADEVGNGLSHSVDLGLCFSQDRDEHTRVESIKFSGMGG